MYKLIFLVALVFGKKYRSLDSNVKYSHGFIPRGRHYLQDTLKATDELPSRFDWRDKVDVLVRSQENCGSCWAFATVSPLEYLYSYKTNLDMHLSEQYLVSCNTHNYSCNGGWWDYDDLIKNGVVLFDDYPYDSKDEKCKRNPKKFDGIKVIKWGYTGDKIEQIKTAIMKYGPVIAGVAVDQEFYNYLDGVYDHDSDEHVNHAIVLVGWDDTLRSWILRNSWSYMWGSEGYMYIQYGVSSVGTDAAYVIAEITEKNKLLF